MKNILVLGSTGMLGLAVTEYFNRRGYWVRPINRKIFDIAKNPIEEFEIHLTNVEVVINCAGVIKPRISVMPIEDVLAVNSIFPRNLARLTKRKGIKCFHITTDCVYSGEKGYYSEADYFDADDIYGRTKNAGETNDCMVLRTSIVGEENGKSRSLFEWVRNQTGKEVKGFTNHLWNGVTTVYLAEIIEKIIQGGLFGYGIFHIHSRATISKYELLKIFNDVYDLRLTVNPSKARVPCDRSLTSEFDLAQRLCRKSIYQQVKDMRDFFSAPIINNDDLLVAKDGKYQSIWQ